MSIDTVGLVGGGQMGAGIAELAAKAGCKVIVREINAEAVEGAEKRLSGSFGKALDRGKIEQDAHDAAIANLSYTTDLADLADCDLVVEAVVESPQVKHEIFQALDEVCTKPEAIFASNTSSIPIASIAVSTKRPENVVGLHFFNPAPVMKLVEVIPSILTSDDVVDRVRTFAADRLDKEPVMAPDRSGFIVNFLLVPYLVAAIRMLGDGHATVEDIDNGMKLGCGHPMGPLTLSDMIGLDTIHHVAVAMFDEYKEQLYAPPPLLSRMVEGGLLGRKTGKGFYDY